MNDVSRYGHALGNKANTTRTAVMWAFGRILESTPWHKVRMVDVAHEARVSAATVYTYYADIEALARAYADHARAAGVALPPHLAKIIELLDFEAAMNPGAP